MWCELIFFYLQKIKPNIEKGTKPILSIDEHFRVFFP